VKLAFYLDSGDGFRATAKGGNLFHASETIPLEDFWREVCGTPNGLDLIRRVHAECRRRAQRREPDAVIKDHFARPQTPAKVSSH